MASIDCFNFEVHEVVPNFKVYMHCLVETVF